MKKYLFVVFYIFFITIIISFIFCTNKINKVSDYCSDCSIDSISVAFYNIQFETPLARKESDLWKQASLSFDKIRDKDDFIDINYEGVICDIIRDCKILREIEVEYDKLRIDSTALTFLDVRIAGIVYLKTGKQQTFSISGDCSSYIFKDDKPQTINLKFVYLVKKYIKYYSWFSRSELKCMEELNSKSFPIDSILITDDNIEK